MRVASVVPPPVVFFTSADVLTSTVMLVSNVLVSLLVMLADVPTSVVSEGGDRENDTVRWVVTVRVGAAASEEGVAGSGVEVVRVRRATSSDGVPA